MLLETYCPIWLTLASNLEDIQVTPVGLYPGPVRHTMCEEQDVFRQGHSTTLQLVKVVSQPANPTNRHQATGAVLLDMSNAFDKVRHEDIFILTHTHQYYHPLCISYSRI